MTLVKSCTVDQTRTFKNAVKKLHENQKHQLDLAIRQVVSNPEIGELKKGELTRVRVYKFKMVNQLMLLAYTYETKQPTITLLTLGSHENFYRDLKS